MQEKVRTGAIEVRKVRGDMKHADLFTKHLPSKENIHQLVRLFGCECRSGTSSAAPLLRSDGSSGGKGGQPSTSHLPAFVMMKNGTVTNQRPHDPDILPHLYGQIVMDELFPILSAPPARENTEDWTPGMQKDSDMGGGYGYKTTNACRERVLTDDDPQSYGTVRGRAQGDRTCRARGGARARWPLGSIVT